MIQARDVMTQNPVCLLAGTDVLDAVDFFLKHQVSSAPVVTSEGAILGQLTELELMRAFVKRQVQDTPLKTIADFKDLLLKPEFVLTAAPLPDVVRALIRSPLHRVLVRDGKGLLAGIISPKDILRAFVGETLQRRNMLAKLAELESQVKGLSKKLETAEESIEQYRQSFETSGFMMASADTTGKILVANEMLHKTLGYKPDELTGKSIYEIYPLSLHELVRKGMETVVKEGRHEFGYSSLLTKTGKILRVEVFSSSLKADDGQFVGTLNIARTLDGEDLLRALHGVLDRQLGFSR